MYENLYLYIFVFLYFGSDIFESLAGDNIDAALLQQIIVGGTMMLFTGIAIWSVDKVGRKPLINLLSVRKP